MSANWTFVLWVCPVFPVVSPIIADSLSFGKRSDVFSSIKVPFVRAVHLTKRMMSFIIFLLRTRLYIIGAWLSLVEHLAWDQGVAGSNPAAPTIASVAQSDRATAF